MSNNKSCFSSFCRIGRKKQEPEVAKFADTSEIFSESQQSTVVQIDFRGDAGSASKTTNYNEESQPNSKNANNADAQFCATCASKLTTARTDRIVRTLKLLIHMLIPLHSYKLVTQPWHPKRVRILYLWIALKEAVIYPVWLYTTVQWSLKKAPQKFRRKRNPVL